MHYLINVVCIILMYIINRHIRNYTIYDNRKNIFEGIKKKSKIEKYFHLYQKLLNQIYLINFNERSIHKVLTIEGYTYMMHWVKQNIEK